MRLPTTKRFLCGAVVALACWHPDPLSAEVTFVAVGYDHNGPNLERLQSRLDGAGRTRLERELSLGGGGDVLWVLPWLRWLWLSSGYSYYNAENEDGVSLTAHTVELGPALYLDLFPLVVHVDIGATRVKPTFEGPPDLLKQDSDKWLSGVHGIVGFSYPIKRQLGLQVILRYQNVADYSVSGTDVDFDGCSFRIGLAYLPDEDSRLLNW